MLREMTSTEALEIITNNIRATTVKQDMALAIAQTALEKQKPQKPVAFERTAPNLQSETCPYSHYECEYIKPFSREYKYTDYKCPSCDRRISDGTPNYCCHCGRALDWCDNNI